MLALSFRFIASFLASSRQPRKPLSVETIDQAQIFDLCWMRHWFSMLHVADNEQACTGALVYLDKPRGNLCRGSWIRRAEIDSRNRIDRIVDNSACWLSCTTHAPSSDSAALTHSQPMRMIPSMECNSCICFHTASCTIFWQDSSDSQHKINAQAGMRLTESAVLV